MRILVGGEGVVLVWMMSVITSETVGDTYHKQLMVEHTVEHMIDRFSMQGSGLLTKSKNIQSRQSQQRNQ